ncbi:unnamed protein product [Kluyveromyces dobzhanskii CBS 2104]|uniref:WGS project CCBQ000000000 data, contig 00008 n=1 Tax=Kluyveromyces dobzhanskii CBS 2104 TaxID=1427455 RepID=A0A0A8L9E7_9SACH|nr:unnamed protein product [Kluyveromyces dobzhanskii CBS 2104]
MPAIEKRVYYYSNGNSWQWGRWLLFGLLIVMVLAMVFSLNARRRRRGSQPIVGTSWLAPPPSYGQSSRNEANYNPNNPQMTQQPLPLYSENVNQNDMGYYDNEGKFIPTSPQNAYYEGFPLNQQQQQQQQQQGSSTSNTATPVVRDDVTGDNNVHLDRPDPAVTSNTTHERPSGPAHTTY